MYIPLDYNKWKWRLIFLDRCISTNKWVKEYLPCLGHGDVVYSWEQTSGYGRFDRKWIAVSGKSLCCSLVLEETFVPKEVIYRITQIGAIAILRMCNLFGITCRLRWPNDVIANYGKISGVLAEREINKGIIILGVGINVNMEFTDFTDIQESSGASSMYIETQRRYNIKDVLIYFLKEFSDFYSEIFNNPTRINTIWQDNDFFQHGQLIKFRDQCNTMEGFYMGLTEDGGIKIKFSNGKETCFQAGDIVKIL